MYVLSHKPVFMSRKPVFMSHKQVSTTQFNDTMSHSVVWPITLACHASNTGSNPVATAKGFL